MMGASVSSGAHSGLVVVCCSNEDELLPSASLRGGGDVGRREVVDSFNLAGDP